MHPEKAFNLLDEPWLPVYDQDGNASRATLKEIFEKAGELRELRADSPLVTVSLHRFLLAILYRVCPPMTINDWGELWDNGLPVADILKYLENHREGFWLVHPTRPWLQRAELAKENRENDAPITKLMIGAAAQNNKQLFDHCSDATPPCLSAKDAPGILLSGFHWSLGGGKALYNRPNFQHGTLIGTAQTIVAGETLLQTLVLSLIPADRLKSEPHHISVGDSRDCCPWETKQDGEFFGIVGWLLWPSRWIWLLSDFVNDNLQGFRYMAFTSGDLIPEIADPKNKTFFDPWSSVSRSEKHGYGRIGISKDRALWRDFDSLFDTFNLINANGSIAAGPLRTIQQAQTKNLLPNQFQLRLMVFGMANEQAKIILWREAQFRLPAAFFTEENGQHLFRSAAHAIEIAQQCADRLREVLWKFSSTVLESESMKADKDAANRLRDRLIHQHDFWGTLEAEFHLFLQSLSDSTEETAKREWTRAVRKSAEESFRAAMDVYPESSARVWRARVKAEDEFESKINKIIPKEVTNVTHTSVG